MKKVFIGTNFLWKNFYLRGARNRKPLQFRSIDAVKGLYPPLFKLLAVGGSPNYRSLFATNLFNLIQKHDCVVGNAALFFGAFVTEMS